MARRYALRDDRWERIKGLLLGREGSVGVTARDKRFCIVTELGFLGVTYPNASVTFG